MITAKDLIYDDHPLLRSVIDEVKIPLSVEDKELMKQMNEYLKNSQDKKLAKKYGLKEGIGLAAPQIALNKRIIAIYAEDESQQLHNYVIANPKIISHSQELTYLPNGEGCLSVREEKFGFVPRFQRIRIKGVNVLGEEIEIKAQGFISVIIQHELDHLNGKFFYDHIDKINPLMPIPNVKPVDFG